MTHQIEKVIYPIERMSNPTEGMIYSVEEMIEPAEEMKQIRSKLYNGEYNGDKLLRIYWQTK